MKNKINGFLCLITFLAFGGFTFGQIELGGDDKKEKKKKDVNKSKAMKSLSESTTEVYLLTNWSNASRNLSVNEGLFGDPLGERAFESTLNIWSFGLGFKTKINDYLLFDGGISFLRNGESYDFSEVDTSYKYKTTYSYISMPLKVMYYHNLDFNNGTGLTLLAGGGVIPQMFSGYKQEIEITDSENKVSNETIERRDLTSTFVLSAVFNIGIQYRFSETWSLMFIPEYRLQFTDSYTEFDSHDHFGRALGFNVGLSMHL